MDTPRKLIRALYGETEPPEFPPDDPAGREWAAFSEVKAVLDERPRRRPDPTVIDAVVAAAARAPRADRRPVRRARSNRQRIVAGAALALTLMLGVWGLWPPTDPAPRVAVADTEVQPDLALAPEPSADTRMEEVAVPPDPLPPKPKAWLGEDRTEPAEDSRLELARRVEEALREEPPAEYGWDASSELHTLRKQVEILEARSERTRWDEPAMLDALIPAGVSPDQP